MAGNLFSQIVMNDTAREQGLHFFQKGKVDYGLNLGSEFSSVSGFGSALNTSVAPHFYYNVNKRFRIGGGISMTTTNYFNAKPWFAGESPAPSNGSFTTGGIFISGQYLVSDRLTLSGSAFKLFPVTRDPLSYNPFNPISKNGAQGVNFNVDYKVGEHVHIQAGFRYSQGISPYHYGTYNSDPFGQGGYIPGPGSNHMGW